MSEVKLTPLQSSYLAGAGYDDSRAELIVEFNSGATWAYPTGRETLEGLLSAPSAGQYFHRVIKPLGGRSL